MFCSIATLCFQCHREIRTLVQVAMFECHACLGHVSSSQLLAVDACFVLERWWFNDSQPTMLWWGSPSDASLVRCHLGWWSRSKMVSLCALRVMCVCVSGKMILIVTVSFSGCHWQCGERTDWRGREAKAWPGQSRRQQQLSRIWKTIDRGHFAEIVWFTKRSADTLNATLEEAGTLTVVWSDPSPCGLVVLLCLDVAFIVCGGTEGEPRVSIRVIEQTSRTWLELAASLFAWNAVMWFASVPKTKSTWLQRESEAWVSGWIPQDTTVCSQVGPVSDAQKGSFSGRRSGVDFFKMLVMFVCLLVSPTREDACRPQTLAVEFRCWREEVALCTKVLVIVFCDVVWKVVDNFSSCQACVTVVQKTHRIAVAEGSGWSVPHIVRAWPASSPWIALEHRGCVFHHRSCLAAKKKKQERRLWWGFAFMRTTIRKEADLECDATARMFQVVLENVLRKFCWNHFRISVVIAFFAGETIRNLVASANVREIRQSCDPHVCSFRSHRVGVPTQGLLDDLDTRVIFWYGFRSRRLNLDQDVV